MTTNIGEISNISKLQVIISTNGFQCSGLILRNGNGIQIPIKLLVAHTEPKEAIISTPIIIMKERVTGVPIFISGTAAAVRWNHERLPRHCKYCVTIVDDVMRYE
jgi:hypothetical protein